MITWLSLLLIVGAVLFAVVSVLKRDWAISLVVIALPSYLIRFHIFSIPFTYLETLILILFFSFVVTEFFLLKKSLRSILHNPFFWPIVVFWISGTISIFVSPDLTAALGIYKAYIIEPVLFFFVFVETIKTKRQFKSVIWSLGILAIWVSLIAVAQFFTGVGIPAPYNEETPRRATSLFPYPNSVSLLLTPIFILFAVIFLKVRFFRRTTVWWGLGILLLTLFAIIASVSEGAWASLVITLGAVILFTKYRWKFLIFSVFVSFGLMLIPISREYIVRLITFHDVSGDVRLALWQGTWNMLQDRPIFGAGLSGFPTVYAQYKLDKHVEFLQYPHNIFFNWWSELGILGLVTLLWLLFIFFWTAGRQGKKRYNDYRSPWPYASALASIVLYGLVEVPYFKNDLSVLFWTIIGLMVAAYLLPEEKVDATNKKLHA